MQYRHFPVDEVRRRFPSLEEARPFVFLDNAAGAQIPGTVIPDTTPEKLEAGTYAYENIAGMDAAISYLESFGTDGNDSRAGQADGSRRERLGRAMSRIAEYERTLSRLLLDEIGGIAGVTIHGVTDRDRLQERVPTLAFTVAGMPPSRIAEGLAARDIGVRSGHMYSPRLLARLGLHKGVVRASLVQNNDAGDVARFRDALAAVVAESS